MKTPLPCLHLGPVLRPDDSSCRRLCRHRCKAGRKAGVVKPGLDCGDHCHEYEPDRDADEEQPVNQLLRYDTLDDRREVHRMLQLLHPRKVIAWLDAQCRKVTNGAHGKRPAPARSMEPKVAEAERRGGDWHYRLATEVYFDWWMMATQYSIDMDAGARELEALTRRQR